MVEVPVKVELEIANIGQFKKAIQDATKQRVFSAGAGGGGGGTAATAKGVFGGIAIAAVFKGMLDALKGIFDNMKKASPALQVIELMLQKAMLIFFKPFGDFLGRLLRPMAASLIKFAVDFARMFKGPDGKTGELDGGQMAAISSGIFGPPGEGPGGGAGGGPGGAGGAGGGISLQETIDQILKDFENQIKPFQAIGKKLADILNENMPEAGEGIKDLLTSTGAAIAGLGIAIGETLSNIDPKTAGEFFVAILQGLLALAAGITVGLTAVAAGFLDLLWDTLNQLWDEYQRVVKEVGAWLWAQVDLVFATVKAEVDRLLAIIQKTIKDLLGWIDKVFGTSLKVQFQKIVDIIGGAVAWFNGLVAQAKSMIGGIVGGLVGGREQKQVGSDFVATTGLAKVHRGEKIVPSSRVGTEGEAGKNIKIDSPISITVEGDVMSDEKVEELAEKITALQKEGLRRSLSYG